MWHQQQQNRTLALLQWIVTDEARQLQLVQEADKWLLDQTQPDIFDDGDPRNVVVQARRGFLKLCAALTEQGFVQPAMMSLADFNAAVEHLTERNKRE